MKKLLSCEFNMDTACVKLKYSDESMIVLSQFFIPWLGGGKKKAW